MKLDGEDYLTLRSAFMSRCKDKIEVYRDLMRLNMVKEATKYMLLIVKEKLNADTKTT